jgi:uncharacterized protein YcbX
MAEVIGRVAAIHRYPVKSMLGEELHEAWTDERGLRGDRAYAVVDVETGSVASAKHPRHWERLLACRASFVTEPEDEGALPHVRIELPDGSSVTSDEPRVDGVLSDALGRSVRLEASARPESSYDDHWPDIEGVSPDGHRNSITREPIAPFAPAGTFFDMTAFHVVSSASLQALARLLPETHITAARFRPNFVIETDEGASGFVENGWVGRSLQLGPSLTMKLLLPTMRCVMTTLAQEGLSLPSAPEVLKALVRENLITVPDGKRYPCLGVYGSLARKVSMGGHVQRGDDCQVG